MYVIHFQKTFNCCFIKVFAYAVKHAFFYFKKRVHVHILKLKSSTNCIKYCKHPFALVESSASASAELLPVLSSSSSCLLCKPSSHISASFWQPAFSNPCINILHKLPRWNERQFHRMKIWEKTHLVPPVTNHGKKQLWIFSSVVSSQEALL